VYEFIFAFNSNYGLVLYRFRYKAKLVENRVVFFRFWSVW